MSFIHKYSIIFFKLFILFCKNRPLFPQMSGCGGLMQLCVQLQNRLCSLLRNRSGPLVT